MDSCKGAQAGFAVWKMFPHKNMSGSIA